MYKAPHYIAQFFSDMKGIEKYFRFCFCYSIVIFSFCAILGTVYANTPFKHPVETIRVTSLFGESRGDHFHTGIDYASIQPIKPIGNGKVIFYRDKSINPHLLPLGTGNGVVIEHKNGIRSHYHHLEDLSIRDQIQEVSTNTTLGIIGNTGFSLGAHLHLDLEAPKEEKILNPVNFLPRLSDNNSPQIVSMLTKINKKIYRIKKKSSLNYQGELEIFTVSWDKFTPNGRRVNPKTIEMRIDNQKKYILDFNMMSIEEGRLVLKSGQTFEETYGLDFNYRLGSFFPSKRNHKFTIVTKDNANYQTAREFSINFR